MTAAPIDFSANDPLQLLEWLAPKGWAVSMGHYLNVWTCAIGPRTIGSVTYGMFEDTVTGAHPTSIILAITGALAVFKEKHPEVFE